jgi:exopolyphosphatase/guanosine-5'-triphosphate,3'-diphosphate pyrophosphatase
MEKKSIKELKYFIKDHGLENIAKQCSISASRIMFIPYAMEILEKLCSVFKPKDIAISSYGIREGMLYEKMPQMLKDRDPLIEACRFAEAKDSRVPGAGKALFNFVKPLFSNSKESQTRLIQAACYLHDVSWRAHPDYRHEACFDYITRANLGGLKHSERVFLGLALLFRYKNSHSRTSFDPLLRLLSSQKIKDAEILGKAMRLGANLWVTSADSEAYLKYAKKKSKLSLKIGELDKKRLGEVSLIRLDSLAKSLKAEVEISDI